MGKRPPFGARLLITQDESGEIGTVYQSWEPLTKESAARRRAIARYRQVFQDFKQLAESGKPITHETFQALLDYYNNACCKDRVRHFVEEDFIEAIRALVKAIG